MKGKTCCDAMRYHSSNHCPVHSSPFECPDWLILHDETTGDYSFTNEMVISAYNSAIGDRRQQEENVYAVLKKLKDFLLALNATAPY